MSDAGGTSQISFPKMEEEILSFWKSAQIFEKSIDPKKKAYSFYDGPPFASGLPHYGHLLASTLKDIVPRYWTMRGYRVPRRWGWDCHGLPIEQEIDKKYEFKSTGEIEKFGIARYNEECKSIVLRFSHDWEEIITRLGRWVDFKNDYKTMDRNFMESVWWVFNELWKKKLIYRGYKVMAFSTALGTPLSNFEASSNYQDVQDPAITVSFPLVAEPATGFLAWTTTPWTLPSNLALAVGRDLEYAKVKTSDGKFYWLAEKLISNFFSADVEVIERKLGSALLGLRYIPLFEYFSKRSDKFFQVIASDHVTTESGTGIVHMAPAFGEDDFYACQSVGIPTICPVDNHGKFTDEVSDYKGQYVKDADKLIIKNIKERGRLFKQDTIQHAYPFCPRTDTPLIYKAVSSWFVKVEGIKNALIKNNASQTKWIPEHLRDGRFGKWLENARDWAISRNRYWGNPLPIWETFDGPEDQREYLCFGSAEELEKITGRKLPDLHRQHLDDILIEKSGKKYRRVPEVLDCWFESGSMPYAQYHYPFENKAACDSEFPADFIGEGLDQTRGWFYTLSVLGTILFDRIPFKHVVVNGMILAEDGKKMSKRLKNYPDPVHVMKAHGADALRLYLIDSPVIRAEELRFSERGVQEIVRRVLLKVWNAFSFFDSYAQIDKYQGQAWTDAPLSKNILDRWIVSRLQSLLHRIEIEMTEYRLYNVVPGMIEFIEELTNTYIRLNRPRFWEEGFSESKKGAFDTLHYVLSDLTKVLAPFAPFISEHLYGLLKTPHAKESVHLEEFPRSHESRIDSVLEQGVSLLEEVILLGRGIREKEKIKVKLPLKELIVVHRKSEALESLKPLENYLKLELNVRAVQYRQDENSFVQIEVKPNGATLGPRAGKEMKSIAAEIAKLGMDQLSILDAGKDLTLHSGFTLNPADIRILRKPVAGKFPVNASSRIGVALDVSIDRDQELEGLAREVVNRVQKLRKDSGLQLDDRIHLTINAEGALAESIKTFENYIKEQTLSSSIRLDGNSSPKPLQSFEIEGESLRLGLDKVV